VTTPLPSNVDYCTITGRIGETYVTPAGDHVFGPTTGLVITFRAVPVIYDPTADPDPTIMLPRDQVFKVDGAGYVVDSSGDRAGKVIATNDADLSPIGWTYVVSFSGPAYAKKLKSFGLVAPAGGTIDLGSAIGTAPSAGHTADSLAIAIAQANAAAAAAAASAADAAESAEEAAGGGGGGGGGPIVAADGDITDATALAVDFIVNAELPADARQIIGAGTSNVAIGTTSGTAADAASTATSLAAKADAAATSTALAGKASTASLSTLDASVVKLSGNQTVAGIKTFTDGVAVPDASIPLAKINAPTGFPPSTSSGIANMPSGYTHHVFCVGDVMPATPVTTRTDIRIVWHKATAPTGGGRPNAIPRDGWELWAG
jgi:hypothetical protein